ncbi:TetR/AcrR family transcriptional regulator [Pseudoprevotella muciniphila]|uniref:TetR/AcrR family transcriptional regulator n=1 Tax=Pseudoprevotella muciniphila TaxID=2133944 RepID=A0A5P8E4S3_9BACT|nr:TetR/AcrR family transcriptional regulator [Pseudoprevotella muciniphila]QFQ11924.1 TetR/AcrR family transcriptional regulator [Pseudoprevotella muciniphila]
MPKSTQQDSHNKERIIAEAISEFKKNGIRSTTMNQISQNLRISKRTLYEIYDSKEELLLDCLKAAHNLKLKKIEEIAEHSCNVLEFIIAFYSVSREEAKENNPNFVTDLFHYPRALDFFRKMREDVLNEAVSFLKKGVEEGVFELYFNYEIFYTLLSRFPEFILREKAFAAFTPDETSINTTLIYLRGCTTKKGREMIDNYIKGLVEKG